MNTEIWKPVTYCNKYEVSSLGRIRNTRGRILKTYETKSGYIKIGLKYQNSRRNFFLHRLVATAFIPNPLNKPHVNHKNGIKTDNTILNLEWCTRNENMRHYTDSRVSLFKVLEVYKDYPNIDIKLFEQLIKAP